MLCRLPVAIAAISLVVLAPRPAATQAVSQVTVPLIVQANRPFVILTFHKPDGTTRTARFLLDTGGGGFLITEPLARELGLTWGAPSSEEGTQLAVVTNTPTVSVGNFPLTLTPERTIVMLGRDNTLPAATTVKSEGMLPGHVLSQYEVVFDYPGRTLTIAMPNTLTHAGAGMRMPVGSRSGFPRTEVMIGDSTYAMLLDTGASFTMVSETVLEALGAQHPDWERHTGAFGEAALLGGQTLETMFVPGGIWGSQTLPRFGVVSQQAGTFERYMSQMMAAPIVGSLAGNVLKGFRVDLDYPHQMLYLTPAGR